MKIGVIWGQKQSDKRKSAGVSTLLRANWLKNCVCKVIFLLSSYSVFGALPFGKIFTKNPLFFYDKILAITIIISGLFIPPFLFWCLCQDYNKSLAIEEKKGVSGGVPIPLDSEAEKNEIFKPQFAQLIHTFYQHFTENLPFISNRILAIFMSIHLTFPSLMPLSEL